MFSYRQLKPLALGLAVLAGGMSPAIAASSQTGTVLSNAAPARVWFLRPASGPDGHEWGASPMVYANGASLGAIRPNTKFYRDFTPGTYSFTVDPYGVDSLPNTVNLAPGSETHLAVEWVPTWEEGIPSGQRLFCADDAAAARASLPASFELSGPRLTPPSPGARRTQANRSVAAE